VSAARARVADAARAVLEARGVAERCAAAWAEAAQGFGLAVTSAEDLERQANRLRTLRLHADRAAQQVEKAAAEERRCTAALLEATMDKRKLERWQDRLTEREQERIAREERRGSDELAARVARGRT
jgi:hypothetical protein